MVMQSEKILITITYDNYRMNPEGNTLQQNSVLFKWKIVFDYESMNAF